MSAAAPDVRLPSPASSEDRAPLRIELMSPADAVAWDAFVTAHKDGTFFHLSAWARVLKRAFGHRSYYLTAKIDSRIVGVLPLARVRSALFGDALASTPFCVYGGALADDETIRKALEDRAGQLADELQVDHLELRNTTKTREDWPVKELYFTFRKQLDADPEKNMLAIPRKQRAEVRAGIKNNLQVEFDTDTRRLYSIYSTSVRALGTPVFSRKYFDVLREEFGAACEISTIVHEGNAVASLMTFWFRDEVLPYYGGGMPAARPLSAYDFLYWDLMRRACERGTRIYDFGRSKIDTGPFRYKKHWGFEPKPLPYSYKLVRSKSVPNLSPTNPKYKPFIEAWKRVPLPVTQFIGPMVAKYLG
ncbi:MAG TPA: FemAB family XrtA/PEP-CTERM system-associated protein [Steroidobacteraceae bacterium]|nr:FemAB family XrtA/PEP-CTERM system-associated protein [Steroidobacteraceae bacterium]